MPLPWNEFDEKIAEVKTLWIQKLRKESLFKVYEYLHINVTDENTVVELRATLCEFVQNQPKEPSPIFDMVENTLTVRQVLKDIDILDSDDREKVYDFIWFCKYAREILQSAVTGNLLKAVLNTRIKDTAARVLEYKSIDIWDALEEELKSISTGTRTLAFL